MQDVQEEARTEAELANQDANVLSTNSPTISTSNEYLSCNCCWGTITRVNAQARVDVANCTNITGGTISHLWYAEQAVDVVHKRCT